MLDGAVHTALDCTVISPEQPAGHKKDPLIGFYGAAG